MSLCIRNGSFPGFYCKTDTLHVDQNHFLIVLLLLGAAFPVQAQDTLSLKRAVSIAVENYGTLKAKASYAEAAKEQVGQAKRDYLPNFNLAAQQDYGTINGQNGPLYGFGGLGVSSSGIPLDHQNWNAAFGAHTLQISIGISLPLAGPKKRYLQHSSGRNQEYKDSATGAFKHEVKVAATYLNLLAAHQLTRSYEKNLSRADTFRRIVTTRTLNGLIAGVDSSQANAELSNARISLSRAKDLEQEQSNLLAQLMGVPPQDFVLDTFFISRVPAIPQDSLIAEHHPLLQWYKSRIAASDEQAKYFKTFYYPAFSLVAAYCRQEGSGFGPGYTTNPGRFQQRILGWYSSYRTNYLLLE